MLKRIAAFIRKIDLTSILFAFLGSTMGFWGKIASFFLKPIVKAGEDAVIDEPLNDFEQAEEIKEIDQAIDEKAKTDAEKIANAKTDDEFDSAIRDSQR